MIMYKCINVYMYIGIYVYMYKCICIPWGSSAFERKVVIEPPLFVSFWVPLPILRTFCPMPRNDGHDVDVSGASAILAQLVA